MVSITTDASLRYRPGYKYMKRTANAEDLRQHKSRFSFIVEQILTFTSSTNMDREVHSMSPNFKRIAKRCLILYITLIRIERSILS